MEGLDPSEEDIGGKKLRMILSVSAHHCNLHQEQQVYIFHSRTSVDKEFSNHQSQELESSCLGELHEPTAHLL